MIPDLPKISCEIHTEYFTCLACRAEVKHNLKNISLHLQNSHQMNPSQYEEQYGRVPDTSVDNDYGSSDIGTVLSAQGVTETAEDYGFGSHFMTMEDEEELAEPPNFQVKFGFNKGSLFIIRGVKIRTIALL